MAKLRREANLALQVSHSRFESLFNVAPIGMFLIDAELRIRQANPTATSYFASVEPLVGSDFAQLMQKLWQEPQASEIIASVERVLQSGRTQNDLQRIERRLNGEETRYYEWRLDRISLSDDQFGVVCCFIDVTRHVLAREALTTSELLLREREHQLRLLRTTRRS